MIGKVICFTVELCKTRWPARKRCDHTLALWHSCDRKPGHAGACRCGCGSRHKRPEGKADNPPADRP